jgi:hypothetical protein
MVATIAVQRMTGVTPTYTTVNDTTIPVMLRTDDANTNDLTNPVPIDTVLRRSYYASICLDLSGTFSQVDHIRHHKDATNWTYGTAGKLKSGNRDNGGTPASPGADNGDGVPDASYDQAGGTVGTSGDDFEATGAPGHAYYNTQTAKSDNMTSHVGLVNAQLIDEVGRTTAGKTKHIVLQVEVDTDATAGEQTAIVCTWTVDEI